MFCEELEVSPGTVARWNGAQPVRALEKALEAVRADAPTINR